MYTRLNQRLYALCVCVAGVLTQSSVLAQSASDWLTFHGDRQRTGWRSNETILTPASVSGGKFGTLWNSPQLDSITIGSTTYPPHLYASPLYVDKVTMTGGPFSVVYAATSNGYVYAVNAITTTGSKPVAAGTILWSKRLTTASVVSSLDGGMPLGILSTPIIDTGVSPPRIYVASADAAAGWQVFALDITNGQVLTGWPLSINNGTLAPINQNGPTIFQAASAMSQRGALNLSPDGKLLYVPFGAYGDGGAGWMVAVSTTTPALASAFAGAPSNVAFANGGMWSSGGPAVDLGGRVYVTTGNGTTANETTPGYWGQSVLVWAPGTPLALAGTYTPWNYCPMETADIDLSGGAAIVLPALTSTSTPNLLAFGGKQGNDYLLDRDRLPGSISVRQGCSSNAATDRSLLPPGIQPQFGTRGPLNVFGPYSDTLSNTDYAKSRSTPAYFHAANGSDYLFVTGSTKQNANSITTTPPCIARLKIVTPPGQPAYLAIDQYESTLALLSPGSSIITSNVSATPILWILVANVLRSQSLLSPSAPHPILYALDPLTMKILWQSNSAQLNVGGKYNTPAIAAGVVFVGTDRIQAFGINNTAPPQGIAIDACGPAAGAFVADTDVSGGHCNTFTQAVDTTGISNPAPQVVYQSKRTGANSVGFTYTIPNLTVGHTYNVRLHFADDLANAAGKRQFNVSINGTTVLPNFDIYASAGKMLKAVVRQFAAQPNSSGQIAIQWTYGTAGNPLASGIEVLP